MSEKCRSELIDNFRGSSVIIELSMELKLCVSF